MSECRQEKCLDMVRKYEDIVRAARRELWDKPEEHMGNRYGMRWLPIETESHPTWATHYIQRIDIIDTETDKAVHTVKDFSTEDGRKAAEEARKKAVAWIQEREMEDATLGASTLPAGQTDDE